MVIWYEFQSSPSQLELALLLGVRIARVSAPLSSYPSDGTQNVVLPLLNSKVRLQTEARGIIDTAIRKRHGAPL